jgi:flagellar basal body rod protein FlgG
LVRGFYAAASGMMAASMQEEVIARNLANADTPGYQPLSSEVSEFAPMMVAAYQGPGSGAVQLLQGGFSPLGTVGMLGSGDLIAQTPAALQPGNIQTVGNPLAAALTGPGYFVVRTAQGLRYTRDGDFTINSRGQLATQAGDPVLGTNGGPITVQPGAVLQDGGAVTVGGRTVGTLRVVQARAPANLVPANGSLLFDPGSAGIANLVKPSILAGALEMPGIDMGQEMVNLIEAERAYGSSQSMLMTTDQTVNTAISEVGKALA